MAENSIWLVPWFPRSGAGPGVLAALLGPLRRVGWTGPAGALGPRGFAWSFLRRFQRDWRGLPRSVAARAGRGHGQGARVDAAAPVLEAEAARPRNPLSTTSVGYEPLATPHTQGAGEPAPPHSRRAAERRMRLWDGSCYRGHF